jgi:hypothetical protein
MILSGSLKQADMAAVNTRTFDFSAKRKAPPNGTGQRHRITPQMLTGLREHLLEKPGLHRVEMTVFLYNEFGVLVVVSSSSRALADIEWSKKPFDVLPKNETQIPEIFNFITFPSFVHIISFTSMSQVAINESASGELAGPLLVQPAASFTTFSMKKSGSSSV